MLRIQKLIFARWRLLSVGMMLMLVACGNSPSSPFVKKEVDKIRDQQREEFKLPSAVRAAILNGEVAAATKSKENPVFDISVVGMPAKNFFLSLVADSDINVVVDPLISGDITLELKKVTVEDVLRVTRDVFGYEYRYDKGIYTISPRIIQTEIFSINYLDIKREGETLTSVIIGAIESSNGSNNNSNSRSNSNNSDRDNNQSSGNQTQGILSGADVKTTHKTDFWASLRTALEAIVGSVEGSAVVVNSQSGLVLVKALPRELKIVRNFLEKSQLSVKRQVILETKILEVSLNDDYKTGINWGEIQGAISYDSNWNRSVGSSQTNESFSSVFSIVDISKFLSLLETQGVVQVLSSPRVSTVNNQKALIRVGVDEFFVTGVSSNTTSNIVGSSSSPEVDLTSFFSGISLDVTPQIAEDGDVILHIHPIVSEVKDQQKTFTVDSRDFSLPVALRDVRESDSIVRAKNGQVVVLGGLMKERREKIKGKRPFLGDIPGLKVFFRTNSDITVKSELVILMRPIVANDGIWNDLLEDSSRRLDLVPRR